MTRIQVTDLKRHVQLILDYTDTAYMEGMANFRIISFVAPPGTEMDAFHAVTANFFSYLAQFSLFMAFKKGDAGRPRERRCEGITTVFNRPAA